MKHHNLMSGCSSRRLSRAGGQSVLLVTRLIWSQNASCRPACRRHRAVTAVASPTKSARRSVRRSTPAESTNWPVPGQAAEQISETSAVAVQAASDLINSPLVAMIALNLGAALFGSNQVVIKMAEHDLSPNSLSAIRFAIAAICFSPLAIKGFQNSALRLAALELGVWLFGGYTAQALGLEYTTAARGAFTGTFTVLAVPLLVGFSGRKVPATTWAAAVVALFGVGLLTTGGTGFTSGDALCIASAVLFGVHKFRTETVTDRFKSSTRELVAVQLAVLAIISAAVCLPELADAAQGRSPGQLLDMAMELPWPSLAYMGLGTTALTLWIEMSALKQVSAPLAALIYTAEPLWGALFAWVLLGERWGSTGWVGAFLIVASSLAAQLSGQERKVASDLGLSQDEQ